MLKSLTCSVYLDDDDDTNMNKFDLVFFSIQGYPYLLYTITVQMVSMNHCNHLRMPEIQVAVRQFKELSSKTHA